jgi:hypothetical protein
VSQICWLQIICCQWNFQGGKKNFHQSNFNGSFLFKLQTVTITKTIFFTRVSFVCYQCCTFTTEWHENTPNTSEGKSMASEVNQYC